MLAARIDGETSQQRPQDEQRQLQQAIASARTELDKLVLASGRLASEILEFQLEFLGDSKLVDPALQAIGEGRSAADAWRDTLDREIATYRADNNEYFRARASDLADLRDRVLRALHPEQPTLAMPEAQFWWPRTWRPRVSWRSTGTAATA